MLLLFDLGNTNTHVGLANDRRVTRQTDIPTGAWHAGKAKAHLVRFVGDARVDGVALCSVVPRATPRVRQAVRELWKRNCLELTPKTLRGVGIDYPHPRSARTVWPMPWRREIASARRWWSWISARR